MLAVLDWETLIAEPVRSMLSKIMGFLPTLLGALIILVVGWIIAKLLRQLIDKLLQIVRFDTLADKTGISDVLKKGDSIATLESVKAAADVYLPASGKVVAINQALPENPEKVNSDPWGEAWMVKIELTDPAELNDLLDAASYEAKIAESK